MTTYIGTNGNNYHKGPQTEMIGKGGADFLQYTGPVSSVLHGDDGRDFVVGNEHSDTLYGGRGADALYGYFGDDFLYGGHGGDRLEGMQGDDVLRGGRGDDKFVFRLVTDDHAQSPIDPGFDLVSDFKPNKDLIIIYGASAAHYDKASGIVSATGEQGTIDIAQLRKGLKINDDDFHLIG